MATPFVIERSRVIPAAPEQIRPHLVDFRKWVAWSPWEELDADLQRSYSGAEQGVGAKYAWAGKKAGEGTMEITDASDSEVDIRLLFTKPFRADNRTLFRLEPVDGGTRVTWRMTGERGAFSALFVKLFRMDPKIEADFDKGLVGLDQAARG